MMELVLLILLFIFILFIRELGIPKLLYEELYTNPTARKMIPVFGDVLYMVGASIGRIASFRVQVLLNHALPIPTFTIIPVSAFTTKQVPIDANIPSIISPSNKLDN
jgi:hypothetical protein